MITDLRTIARALGGQVVGRQVTAPGPGHSARDRSLSIHLSMYDHDGFIVFSHAGDDWKYCKEYVRSKLGITSQRPALQPRTPRPPTQPTEIDAWRAKYIVQTVAELQPIIGTPGERWCREPLASGPSRPPASRRSKGDNRGMPRRTSTQCVWRGFYSLCSG